MVKYIFGKNISKENIGITAPVFQEKSEDGWIMQFTMPERYTMETLPRPKNEDITIRKIEGKKNGYKEISKPQSTGYDPPWTIPFSRRNEIQIEIE